MQTIRPVKISSLGHLSTSHKAGNGEMEETGRKERLEEEEGVGTREGDIDQTAGLARCSFSTFHHPLPSTLQHRDTLLDSLDWGGAGGLVFQAKQSSHTSSADHSQISQRI